MKKVFALILTFMIFISFAYASDGSIKYVGSDIILTYGGNTITRNREEINPDTQKCPYGYHVGTKQEWLDLVKMWYDINGSEYDYLSFTGGGLLETYDKYDEDKGKVGGILAFWGDLKLCSESAYKINSYCNKHQPCIFINQGIESNLGEYTRGFVGISSCFFNKGELFFDMRGHSRGCSILKTRCFKDINVLNNGYSKEFNDAYIFAYNNGITSMETIEKANMYGEIKRMEIAKMLANWAKKMGYYADPKIKCEFTDTSSVKGDLATAIVDSCKLGIMGQGVTKFRPYDNITVAEVATAISRIIWGDNYNGGIPYYINHVNALKNEGILTNDNNLNTKAKRGNVMILLMRADEKSANCDNCYSNCMYCPAVCMK